MRAAAHRAYQRAAISTWAIRELPRWLQVFAIGLILAYSAALTAAAVQGPLRLHDLEVFAILLAFGITTIELTRRHSEPTGLVKDLHAVWYLPVALLLPPAYGLAAPIPVLLLKQIRVRRALIYRRAYTAAAIGLSLGAASAAFHATVGPAAASLTGSAAGHLRWAVLAAGCGALRSLINRALIITAIKGSEPAASIRQLAWNREVIYNNDLAELCLAVVMSFAVAHATLMIIFALPFVTLLQRSFRHAQLTRQARIDAKTGLLNAATWQREAHTEVTRATRTATPLAAAMIDIDHFKTVNDTYGHLAGDAVLASIAAAIHGLLRDYDIAGRFGGEEFAILLPHTTGPEAHEIAERLREKLAQIVTPVTNSTGSVPLRVTVSIGVAALTSTHHNLGDLLADTDAALYQAKQSGRNLTCLSGRPANGEVT